MAVFQCLKLDKQTITKVILKLNKHANLIPNCNQYYMTVTSGKMIKNRPKC